MKDLSKFFKALSCEWRLKIIEIIGNNEICQCKLSELLPIDSTTLSRHLKILKDGKILKERKEGRKKFYSLYSSKILEIIEISRKVWGGEYDE